MSETTGGLPRDTARLEKAAGVDADALRGEISGRDGGPQDASDMQASEEASAAYSDMLERGARQEGEGRLP
jgi:hypothetical protein